MAVPTNVTIFAMSLIPARLRSLILLSGLLLLIAWHCAQAQGGPPFLTDDPDTPGNRHWEINVGFIADHNPGDAYYQTPDFDFNYGLGDRIQLKYELPIASHTDEHNVTDTGLGESLLGVKWRFYEHRRPDAPAGADDAVNFAIGTYPQLALNNPTSAVRRGIVYPGPQFLLPFVANGRWGPVQLDGEAGYWFSNRNAPNSWILGMIASHDLTEKTELAIEIYDQQDANSVAGVPKQRETIFDIGGRQALDKSNSVLLLFMGGRSLQSVTRLNGQPDWVAYVGIQLLFGRKTNNPQVEKTVPVEQLHLR
jgi:hypothetical protein